MKNTLDGNYSIIGGSKWHTKPFTDSGGLIPLKIW